MATMYSIGLLWFVNVIYSINAFCVKSAGPQKVDNKVKKGKKGKDAKTAKSAQQKQQQAAAQLKNKGPRTVSDIIEETPVMADGETGGSACYNLS